LTLEGGRIKSPSITDKVGAPAHSAPCARTLTDKPAKQFIEMGLISEAAFPCDLPERSIGRQHHSLRSLQSSMH
jgi:hypothetical protein